MPTSILTVSQLNRFVKLMFEGEKRLQGVLVSGEISNFSGRSMTGHLYFSLKDNDCVVRAVMFSSHARRLAFQPENGMRVVLTGDVTVYEKGGQYQICVFDMQPDGVGALYVQFEKTKARLAALGLFDAAHKKPLPACPRRIAVITAPGGAALQDILHITARRWPACEMVVCPVLVQGREAPASLIAALEAVAQAADRLDLVILGRGGGSMEDLWAFNNEALAYAIYQCPIPVLSAVGHEVDFTIADFVADLRAPTPSAAAELAVPDRREASARVRAAAQELDAAMRRQLAVRRLALDRLRRHPGLASPAAALRLRRERFARAAEGLLLAARRALAGSRADWQAAGRRLELLSPLSVLSRGYAVVLHNGAALTDPQAVQPGDRLRVRLAAGTLTARVEPNEEEAG